MSANSLEQVVRIVRPRVRLGVVLHAEGQLAVDAQSLADAVVEVDVGHRRLAGERVGVDGEVVVLAGDLDLARGEVAHRVVAAVMTERQLDRAGADRPAEQLVAEADAEDRHLPSRPWIVSTPYEDIAGSPGPLLRNTPSGSSGEDVGGACRRRHDLDGAERDEVDGDVALHPVVDRDDPGAVVGVASAATV